MLGKHLFKNYIYIYKANDNDKKANDANLPFILIIINKQN
jgi:hypothetical protein